LTPARPGRRRHFISAPRTQFALGRRADTGTTGLVGPRYNPAPRSSILLPRNPYKGEHLSKNFTPESGKIAIKRLQQKQNAAEAFPATNEPGAFSIFTSNQLQLMAG